MTRLPNSITRFFWGDNLDELSWSKHRHYITQKLLDIGDSQAVAWLFNQVDKASVKQNLKSYKLNKKSKNFWNTYLS